MITCCGLCPSVICRRFSFLELKLLTRKWKMVTYHHYAGLFPPHFVQFVDCSKNTCMGFWRKDQVNIVIIVCRVRNVIIYFLYFIIVSAGGSNNEKPETSFFGLTFYFLIFIDTFTLILPKKRRQTKSINKRVWRPRVDDQGHRYISIYRHRQSPCVASGNRPRFFVEETFDRVLYATQTESICLLCRKKIVL